MKLQENPTILKLNSVNQNTPKQNVFMQSNTNLQPIYKQEIAFTGAETFTLFLRFLETNQAWGATAVDIGCMGLPRTGVDFTRGPDAGLETMRREFSSTANDALVGAYGLGAVWILSQTFNKDFGVKAHKMLVGDEMLDIFSHTWNEHKNLDEFLNEIVKTAKGFNPNHPESNRIDERGWVGIDEKTQQKIIEKLKKEIEKTSNKSQEMSKDTKAYLKTLIIGSTDSESKFKIEKTVNGKTIQSISSLDDLIQNTYKVAKAFMNDKVTKTFATGNITDNVFIKGLKKLNRNSSIIGLGASAAIGMSLQPLNMYLTKKKTGKAGFVGVEGREPDNSKGFKLLKFGIAGVTAYGLLRSIGKFSKIISRVQFKGLIPTIPQFKFVYSMTIMSRLLAARDKNELRESAIKDSLGFVSWLILGGFVSKLTAASIEKMDRFKNDKFIKYNKIENGKGFFNWLTKSSIITRDEVLHSALKRAGISTIKTDGKAMTFVEMMKAAPKEARIKIKYLGLIQFAGYLYSGIVLGVGIPKLNIAITKVIENKRKAKAEKK